MDNPSCHPFERDVAKTLLMCGDTARQICRSILASEDRDELEAFTKKSDCPKPVSFCAEVGLKAPEQAEE